MPPLSRSVAVRLRAEMAEFRREWRESGNEAERAGTKFKGAGEKAKQTAKPITELETTVARTSARLKQHRAEWDAVGTSMVRNGALIVGAGVLMAKAAMDWESDWAGVTKTVNASDPALRRIEAGLRGLAKTMPETHSQIAAVAEAAGQLGVKANDVVAFTRVMVMLGDTTDLTADEAATSLAQLMNVMGTAPDKVDELASTLVYLGNNGASTEKQIVQMAQRIASAGTIVGMSEADVLSVANAVASTGIEVEAGGSAISSVLMDIGKAVDTGSDKLDKFASVAGMSSSQFISAWRSDPATALAAFTDGLGQLDEKGQSAFKALDELGQSDVRVSRALLNLANSSELFHTSLADGSAEWERNTALVQEAEKRYDTTAAKAKIAWNNIKDDAIDAGQGMLPIISGVADAVSDLGGAFGQLPGPLKGSVGVMALVGGGGLLVVGGLMKAAGAVSDFRQNLAALEVSSPRAAGALGKLGKAFVVVAAAAAASQALEQWDQIDVDGVNQFTKGLIKAADGSDQLLQTLTSADSSGLFGWNRNAVDGIADAFDKAAESKGKLDLSFAHESDWERAGKFVEQIDAALTSTVASGSIDAATDMFKYLREETGMTSKELMKLLPGYKDALAGVANEQKMAAKSADGAAEKATYLNQALGRMGGKDAEEAAKKLDELRQASEDAGNAWTDATLQFDDKSSLTSWISDLEKAAAAQEKWADNMVKAAARGVDADVLAKLQEQGPAAAGVLDQLANGSQKSIDRVNELFGVLGSTSSALAAVRAEVGDDILVQFDIKGDADAVAKATAVANATDLPKEYVRTILEALDWATPDINRVLDGMGDLDDTTANPTILTDDDRAKAALSNILSALKAIDGNWYSNLFVTTHKKTVSGDDAGNKARGRDPGSYTGSQVPVGYAGGGIVPGTPPANPRVDNVMAYGENTGKALKVRSGEWIINEPQSRKNDKWLASINAGLNIDDFMADVASSIITSGLPVGYADGGKIDAVSPAEYTRMKIEIRDLERSLKEKEKYGKKGHRKSRYVLRGLDRVEAKQQLAEARAEFAQQKKVQGQIPKGMTADAFNARNEAKETAATSASSFAGNADITSFSSPASVERALAKAITDMATFTSLLIDLKRKGAAPWLLQQLQKAGPTRGAINLARKYATDSKALASVNAQAAQLDAVTATYGTVTTDARFDAAAAWNVPAAQTRTLEVKVSALDSTTQARETTRQLDFTLQQMAMGAGV